MAYIIKYCDKDEVFVMGDHKADFVGDLLKIIGKENGIHSISRSASESQAVQILRNKGVEIQLDFEY